jgi:hypothetical protein
MIGKCAPCDHLRSLLESFSTLQNQGDGNNGLSCNVKPLNPQNRQAWASFEGFEGGERFQAGLPQPFEGRPSGDNIVRAFGAQKNG